MNNTVVASVRKVQLKSVNENLFVVFTLKKCKMRLSQGGYNESIVSESRDGFV